MKPKYMFVSMGAGEASQAIAVAKHFLEKKEKIVFCVVQKVNLPFLEKPSFPVYSTPNPKKLKEVAVKENPTVVLYFNSKIWKKKKTFQEKSPIKETVSVTVDSNWLFNKKNYPVFSYLKWAKKHLINLSEDIFQLGLKENGGGFVIPQEKIKQIKPIGFVPFYEKTPLKKRKELREKHGIKKNEKLIFAYLGGFGAGHRTWVLEKLLKASEDLRKKGRKIKIVYVGPQKEMEEKIAKNWIIHKENLQWKTFFELLSSSDLVFQHQGLSTLTQTICANIPVIANVKIFPEGTIPKIHVYEVEPFAKTNLCIMQRATTPHKKVCENIEKLLYDKKAKEGMIRAQEKHSQKGEANIYREIKNL